MCVRDGGEIFIRTHPQLARRRRWSVRGPRSVIRAPADARAAVSRRQEVIRLETQYWSLVEVPRQEKTEPLPTFVLRACAVLERTKVTRDGAADDEDEETLDLIDRLGGQWDSPNTDVMSLDVLIPRSTCLPEHGRYESGRFDTPFYVHCTGKGRERNGK